jgi:hypothetical protein
MIKLSNRVPGKCRNAADGGLCRQTPESGVVVARGDLRIKVLSLGTAALKLDSVLTPEHSFAVGGIAVEAVALAATPAEVI